MHQSFCEEKGFKPEHLLLYHSLLGDAQIIFRALRESEQKQTGKAYTAVPHP